MTSFDLAKDYLLRCRSRLKVVELLYNEKNYPDCVEKSRQFFELSLKGILRNSGVTDIKTSNPGPLLIENQEKLPLKIQSRLFGILKLTEELWSHDKRFKVNSYAQAQTHICDKKEAFQYLHATQSFFNLLVEIYPDLLATQTKNSYSIKA